MKLSANFSIEEFVSPSVLSEFGPERAAQFIDRRVVSVAQLLRDLTKRSVTINNWKSDGQYRESGLRTPGDSFYKPFSQHTFGRAIDVKVAGITSVGVYALILEHEKFFMSAGLTTLEDIMLTPGWVHMDCRYTGLSNILIVKP